MNQVLVILGPTASGKSAVAVELAKKFKGEVISADSRQVYRGLDIGSGKITRKEMRGIPHHLLNIASPKRVFTVAQYQKLAKKKMAEIVARGKVPIICGGTGFYIQAVVDGLALPEVKPNLELRKKLEHKTAPELYKMLQALDSARAKKIDKNNPRRLIRAIEITTQIKDFPWGDFKESPLESGFNFTLIGLNPPPEQLKELIKKRLEARLRAGLIQEVENLRTGGLSWRRLESLGLEYKFVALYLQKKISKKELVEQLNSASWHYAKRQLTWWKRDERIRWLTRTQALRLKLKSYNTGTAP